MKLIYNFIIVISGKKHVESKFQRCFYMHFCQSLEALFTGASCSAVEWTQPHHLNRLLDHLTSDAWTATRKQCLVCVRHAYQKKSCCCLRNVYTFLWTIELFKKRLFRQRSKKTSKSRVILLCEGNSPVTGEFPAQKTSNTENFSILWRHHMETPSACVATVMCEI